jgi:Lon protease-like protein
MLDTPMFPLGTVLVPSMVLPLHVFEPRYRALVHRCLADDVTFGVALIERGFEVGGGDVRTDVACMARIVAHEEYPDGRFGIVAVGTERVKVARWLDDDPYPRADTDPWPDEPASDAAVELVPAVELQLVELLDRAARYGMASPPSELELSDDPVAFGHQATALLPVGPLDKLKLLSAPSVESRLELLLELVADARTMLDARTDE